MKTKQIMAENVRELVQDNQIFNCPQCTSDCKINKIKSVQKSTIIYGQCCECNGKWTWEIKISEV